MSRLIVTLAVDDTTSGKAIGVKEAIAMDLEKYGDVKVLQVDVREPEQLSFGGSDLVEEKTAKCIRIEYEDGQTRKISIGKEY